MGVEFKLTKENPEGKPDIAVFHLGGWLDAQSEAQLVEAVRKAKEEGAQNVLLDLRGVDTITSAGIRAIQAAFQLFSVKGESPRRTRLKLCNAPPQVYQVLSITGMLVNVPAYESADIAIDSFDQ
jgi:anti-anti-sigma factor